MTYFGFLARFLVVPLLGLILLTLWDWRSGRRLPAHLNSWPPAWVIGAHVGVALLYTTPWDNYLVATGIWWYNPQLVTGITLGWVPLEEYTFFVLQTLAMGLWVVFLAKRIGDKETGRQGDKENVAPHLPVSLSPSLATGRWRATGLATGIVALIWLVSTALWLAGWQPGTYLTLILAWALFPIMIQLALGADILWHYRRLVFWALLPATLYLGIVDALAIRSGTWTIDPAQSTGIMLGALPLEEGIFFFMTNLLVVFGTVLVLARASQSRVPKGWLPLQGKSPVISNQ